MLKSAIKSYCFVSPDFMYGHFVCMLLCHKMGKSGRVFCKQTSVAACRFQNERNKVGIALRVVQFWSEINIMITNRTPALRFCNHSFDFRPNCTPLSAIAIIYYPKLSSSPVFHSRCYTVGIKFLSSTLQAAPF